MLSKVLTVGFFLSHVDALKIGSKGVSGGMSCQECVSNSHNYCLKGQPWSRISSSSSAPSSVCCPSSGCSNGEDKNSEYTCFEDVFASVDIAIAACPQYEENCGVQSEYVFN